MVVVLGGVGNLLGTVLASFGIGIMTDLIGAGRLLSIWPDMPLTLSNTINFFATTSMARVMIFALIVYSCNLNLQVYFLKKEGWLKTNVLK